MATISTTAAEARGFWGDTRTLTTRRGKEAATQTFVRGRFLDDNAAGFLRGNAADNAADMVGIAIKAGGNGTAAGDKFSEYNPMLPGLLLEVNFLGAADAARTIAQTDLWVGYQYQNTGTDNHITIDATTTTPRLFMVELDLDPAATKGQVASPGPDDNVRVYAVAVGSLCAITPDA